MTLMEIPIVPKHLPLNLKPETAISWLPKWIYMVQSSHTFETDPVPWAIGAHVLLGQLQQHRVVKELVDGHVLTESAPGFQRPRSELGWYKHHATRAFLRACVQDAGTRGLLCE